MSKRQYLYVFSNPSMPGMLKIGSTTRPPHERQLELHSTGVPTPFEIEYIFEVPDCSVCELLAHRALHSYRVTLKREFFRVPLKTALKKIQAVIGPYTEFKFKGESGSRANVSAKSKRDRSIPTKNEVAGKAASAKSVIAPAAWPFPSGSRTTEEKNAPPKSVEPRKKAKGKSAQAKSVITPAAWPFPTSSRP
jgi:hypothetical protein